MQYVISCNSCQYVTCACINIIYKQSSCYSSLAITHNQPTWANKQSTVRLGIVQTIIGTQFRTTRRQSIHPNQAVRRQSRNFSTQSQSLELKCTAILAPNTPTICIVTLPTRHTVSSEGVIFYFFYKLITFKLVYSYNVKHVTCTIFCSSILQNIYKLHIWKCSTFTIFTLFKKTKHIQK